MSAKVAKKLHSIAKLPWWDPVKQVMSDIQYSGECSEFTYYKCGPTKRIRQPHGR